MYFTGFSPQDSGQPSSADIPDGSTAMMGAVGLPQATKGTPQPGMVQAPNDVLQNINNYSGSKGSLMGNANYASGLRNYAALSGGYGQGMGQWEPWAFQSQSTGGFGGNAMNAGDLFIHPGQNNIQAGNDYFNQGGNAMQRSIYRNPYTGQVANYGAGQQLSNPLGADFWKNPAFGSYQNANQGAIGSAMQSAYSSAYGAGHPFDINDAGQQALMKQMWMGSQPGQAGQQMGAWGSYGVNNGYINQQDYMDKLSQLMHGGQY